MAVDSSAASTLDTLARALGDGLLCPGGDGYAEATRPRNTTARQRPVAVVAARSPDELARAVRAAAQARVTVTVQATGHGAAGVVDTDVLLIDTHRLDTITVDPSARTARVGAGVTWAALNAAAQRYGLRGLAGTAPDVGVVGYTIFGGLGWLTRPYGLASASLRRVEYVDGDGTAHVTDGTTDPDGLWAFRGGGGAGIATAVEVDLVPFDDLWAGYALWPIEQAESVVGAWVAALEAIGDDLTSALGFLHAPDAPSVPKHLRGHRVVHLSAASVRGRSGLAPLQDALRNAPKPAIDTFGPCDTQRLSQIHLDPPAPVPAIGDGRWLTSATPRHALRILGSHGLTDDAPLSEIEIRHIATTARADTPGALTVPPGPFLLHAVGPAPTAEDRSAVRHALDTVRTATEAVDAGQSATSFRDGRTTAADALASEVRSRLETIRQRVDPHHRIRPARTL